MATFMDTHLIYNVHPPDGKLNGVAVNANSPGIAPFAFHAQHGSTRKAIQEADVTGFAECTKQVGVHVHNAKLSDDPPNLETHGFELIKDRLHADFRGHEHAWLRDDDHIANVHYRAAEAFARARFPDATAAFGFNHVRRISRQTEALKKRARHAAGLSAPSYMVHTDSTSESWLHNIPSLVARDAFDAEGPTHLSADQGKVLAAADRVVVLNLWRLVTNFGQASPTHLAMCDMRSVDMATALPYHFLVDGCVGFNYGLPASRAPEHKWSYFPNLAADEVVVFKAYDSRGSSDAQGPGWCFHAAVDDPSAPDDCAPRESVEVRVALAFAATPADE